MTTILIVEDNDEILDNVTELLSLIGYDTLKAHDGFEAVTVVQETAVDLVLSDIRMPEMDGWEMLEAIRSNSTTQHIPVAFFTAKADEESILRAQEAGVDGYIVKPFTNDDLLGLVDSLLTSASTTLH